MPEKTSDNAEKAILISLDYGKPDWKHSFRELEKLADTAGAKVAGEVVQKKDKPDPRYYLGKGKIEEMNRVAKLLDSGTVIVDDELTPSQQRAIEEITDLKVIDRTALILDIFAQRAKSSEGNHQVELAQLNYRLSRMKGKGIELSRLGGGIGTRGPGETKLEVDRRRIRKRISHLKKDLAEIEKNRKVQRKARLRSRLPLVALVGYTNSGKSTLMKALTNSEVFIDDKLFATLDPLTKRMDADDEQCLITDTVGFIKKLPHQLIAAFKSTLEETKKADLLLNVIDSSAENLEGQIRAVKDVLEEIGAKDIEMIEVFNKIDLLSPENLDELKRSHSGAVFVSAILGKGLDVLKKRVREKSTEGRPVISLRIPLDKVADLSQIHKVAEVVEESWDETGVNLKIKIDRGTLAMLKKISVSAKH